MTKHQIKLSKKAIEAMSGELVKFFDAHGLERGQEGVAMPFRYPYDVAIHMVTTLSDAGLQLQRKTNTGDSHA